MLTAELEAASPRLVVSGSGRIALTDQMDAELTLRFANTSLDPYLRFFEPRLSPFTTAVAGGTVRVVGELADVDHLVVDARVEQLDLKLFDYRVSNQEPSTGEYRPIELALDQHVLNVVRLRLFGEGTQLELDGHVNLHDSTIAVKASGDANLGILQGFYRDIRSSGGATLTAEINGPLAKPVFSGSAAIANGRVRQLSLPHSLEAINGQIIVRRRRRARRRRAGAAGGRRRHVRRTRRDERLHAGRPEPDGGRRRTCASAIPEGFRSVIDADLSLTGDLSALLLGGTVTVRDARLHEAIRAQPGSVQPDRRDRPVARRSRRRRRRCRSSSTCTSMRPRRCASRTTSRGWWRAPTCGCRAPTIGRCCSARAQIERGDVIFEGNRYLVTRGTIGFANPSRIEPYFDIEAETRVRVPTQTYRITLGFTGTTSKIAMNLNSDPPLSGAGIVLLLFGQTTRHRRGAAHAESVGAPRGPRRICSRPPPRGS